MWTGSGRVYSTCEGNSWVRVDLEFENTSEERVENLHFLDFKAPGFQEVGDCWLLEQHYPACIENSTNAAPLPAALEPGGSVHVWARLKPSVATGRFGLLALYGWSQVASNARGGKIVRVTRSGFVALQPIEVTSPLHEAIGTAERVIQGLLLPIMVAFLAWLFQRFEKNREARRNKLEKTQEIRRSRLESKRARGHEVWKDQLERMLRNTPEHYTHISRTVYALTESPHQTGFRNRVFYDFLMFWLQVRALREQRGGWFLSTKTGENALSSAWAILIASIREHLEYASLERAMDIVRKPESLPNFRRRFDESSYPQADSEAATELRRIEKNFLSWVDNGDKSFFSVLEALKIFRHILRFEWDRPLYEHWYKEQPSFPFDECQKALSRLPSEPKELIEKFRADLEVYLDGVRHFLLARRFDNRETRTETLRAQS